MRRGVQCHVSAALPLGKALVPSEGSWLGPTDDLDRLWQRQKSLATNGDWTPGIQPVLSHYIPTMLPQPLHKEKLSGKLHTQCALAPGDKTPTTQCTRDWVGPRTSLGTLGEEKNLCPYQESKPRSSSPLPRCSTNNAILAHIYFPASTAILFFYVCLNIKSTLSSWEYLKNVIIIFSMHTIISPPV